MRLACCYRLNLTFLLVLRFFGHWRLPLLWFFFGNESLSIELYLFVTGGVTALGGIILVRL
jgi:hypothetical protein